MSKRTHRDKSISTDSLGSEKAPPKKRSSGSTKAGAQFEESMASAPGAVDKGKERAHSFVSSNPNERQVQRKWTQSEKQRLVEIHSGGEGWKRSRELFNSEFGHDDTISALKNVFKREQRKLLLEAGEKPPTRGKEWAIEEFEFIVEERSKMTDWDTIAVSYNSKYGDRRKATVEIIRTKFYKLRRGEIKMVPEELRLRAARIKKYDRPKKQPKARKIRLYTEFEKEWLADERRQGKPWPLIRKSFCGKFLNVAKVTELHLATVLASYLKREGTNLELMGRQTKAKFDIEVLRAHQEYPDKTWTFKTPKILQTDAYRFGYAPKGTTPALFWRRWYWLSGNDITIEKLADFISRVVGAESCDPYETVLSIPELAKKVREQKTNKNNVKEDSPPIDLLGEEAEEEREQERQEQEDAKYNNIEGDDDSDLSELDSDDSHFDKEEDEDEDGDEDEDEE